MIGDRSFVDTYGCRPDGKTPENMRQRTHLAYVEKLLRAADISHLSPELRQKREMMLDLLHEYREAGSFPCNYDYPGERCPCFIDREGRICAVGYLVEKTAGRHVA